MHGKPARALAHSPRTSSPRSTACSPARRRSSASGSAAMSPGYNAANDKGAAAPAAPPARKPALTILYATESGNSETLALAAKKEATRLGLAPRVLDMADTSPADIAKAGDLLIIASTWGEGDAPQRAEPFLAELMAESGAALREHALRRARARRPLLREILRDRAADRRAPGRARRQANRAAPGMRRRLRSAGQGLDRHHAARDRHRGRRLRHPCRFHAPDASERGRLEQVASLRGRDHRPRSTSTPAARARIPSMWSSRSRVPASLTSPAIRSASCRRTIRRLVDDGARDRGARDG